MTFFLKDGTERLVVFGAEPANINAITEGEWAGATDHSESIVKPLPAFFQDSATFAFAVITQKGNGEGIGKTSAGGTLRIVRHYLEGTKQIDPALDGAFAAFGTKNTLVRIGLYRGPKEWTDGPLTAGDEYEYLEFWTDVARVLEDDETYIAYDVRLVFKGNYAAQKVLVSSS